MRIFRIVGLLAVVLTLAGCGEFSLKPHLDGNDGPDQAPTQPEPEALAMALWLSHDLRAPTELYQRVRSDLILIRTGFRDSLPAVDLRFLKPWEPGRLILGFDPDSYQAVSDGKYTAWDSLNSLYNMVRVDLSMPAFNMLKLKFDDWLNSEVLADIYRQLPGVRFAVPNRYMGESPMLLPSATDDGRILYFFRNAWGDCPSGCLYSEYWVFTVLSGRVVYDGYFTEQTLMPDDLKDAFTTAWDHYWQGRESSSLFAAIPSDFH
ncbi:MAG: hypothetical protein OEV49_09700 [candidate division Zixibacteria bacterium]|nr:hypothetical protein [candidate division Zixibacteria bacterium]MDH3938654.1 hypothetical protein [candidate division Zixibacteria bacterium]MDH4032832.1 hypothetical protein [candidate division Zixibacteria bacterium]